MKTDFDSTAKTTIHSAANGLHKGVERVEDVAISSVERVEDTMSTLKVNFEQAKAFGSEVMSVVDTAGRTALGGMVTMNRSIVDYSKDVLTDTIDVSKKSMEARSMKDVVELQTAFAERRLAAAFDTVAALNTLAQNNVMAFWSPLAALARDATVSAEATAKPYAERAEKAVDSMIKVKRTGGRRKAA